MHDVGILIRHRIYWHANSVNCESINLSSFAGGQNNETNQRINWFLRERIAVNSSAVTGLFDTAAGLIPLRCMGVVPPERPAPRCGLEMKPFPLSLLVPLFVLSGFVMSSGEGQPAADIHTEPRFGVGIKRQKEGDNKYQNNKRVKGLKTEWAWRETRNGVRIKGEPESESGENVTINGFKRKKKKRKKEWRAWTFDGATF